MLGLDGDRVFRFSVLGTDCAFDDEYEPVEDQDSCVFSRTVGEIGPTRKNEEWPRTKYQCRMVSRRELESRKAKQGEWGITKHFTWRMIGESTTRIRIKIFPTKTIHFKNRRCHVSVHPRT